jgi:hypothetical protein
MTSVKDDVTFKNPGDYRSTQWLQKVPEFSTSLQKSQVVQLLVLPGKMGGGGKFALVLLDALWPS